MQTETFVRALRRVGATGAAVGSVLLLATCDLEKLAGPKRLNQAAIDSLFAIAGDTIVSLGASLALGMTSSRDISNTATRWSVSPASIAEVDSVSGVVTGMALGNAIITARIIAPEFDTAYTASHSIRVRYKGIAVQPLDSIPGLGLSRSTVVRGTNDAGEAQAEMLPATLTSRDTTIFRVTGTSVVARKAGDAYIVAEYDGLLDSTTVKVRPQPKALAFATAEYVIKTLNVDRLLSAIVRDQGDSIIASPNVTWSVADPTVAAIDAANGTIRALKADTTRLFATVDTITRSLKLVVRQHVAALVPVDGDGQSAPVASPLATGPRVIARDSSGTPVAGASVIFTPSGDGAVGTVVVVTDANGIAAVDAWQLGSAAGTQSLTASVGTASFSFTATATPAPAARLVFSTQPLSVPAGGTVPAVAVAVTDTLGNIVPSAAGTVAITLAANPGSSVLSGTLTATLTDGIATFGDLTLDALGEGYMLAASAAGLEGTVSQTFNVFGAPAKLTFITQPVGGVIRRALAPAIRVQVQDANGIEVRSATGNIALTLIGGPSSILDGASIVAAEAGTATFSNLSVATAGSGYQLRATMAGGLVATSTAFAIEAVGPGVRLGFVAPPANAVAGTALNVGTGVQVGIFDANGNLVTSAPPTSVSLAFGTNAGGAQISGTATLNTVSGIATFSNITINRTGTGYTLVASASALTTATSDAFNVLAGAAARLRFVQQPTNVEVDAPPTAPVQVAITDANENILTSQVAATLINVTLLGCSGLTGGAAVVQGGVATFSALRIASAGNGCALSASSQGLAAVSSQLFSVVPTGGATRMNFAGVLPAAASAGQTLDTVRVTLQNVGGSVVSGAQASVTLSLADGGASALGGTVTQQTMNGVAKFGDLVINLAGAERRIVATATGFAPLTSSPIVVDAAAPTQLAFVSAPSGAAAGSALPAFQVAVRDALGNIVASSSHAVQLALLSNPSGAMLGGVTTVAAVDGVATFAAVHVSASGTGYSLTATAPGTTVASATSAEFSIGAGAPAGLRFATPPATVVANVPFTDDVQVQVVDAQGNPVTAGAMVSVALVGGAGGTTLLGTRTVAAVNGLATFDDLRVSHAGTGLRLSATAPGLAARTSDVFDATLGAPTRLSIRSQPSLMVAAPSVGTVQIAITDAANNTVPTASADITLAIATGTGTLGGTVTRPTLNGVATFDDITLTPAGTFTLRATSVPVFSEVVGGSVVVTPQDLSISEGAGQSGIAGSNVATNPAVLVLDGAGAPVAGVSVTFNATGTGTLNNSAATSVQVMSDASGLASVVWRLRNAAGVDTLIAFLTAGPAQVERFTAIVQPGPAALMAKVTGDGQVGQVDALLAVPTRVKVSDALGNGISGVLVSFAPAVGHGVVVPTSATTDASGVAATEWTLGPASGAQSMTASAGSLNATFTATAIAAQGAMPPVAVGYRHSCRLAATGTVYCWGGNYQGQLGDGSTTNRTTVAAVTGGPAFNAIASGHDHTCALAAGGAAYCWGTNGNGRLGDASFTLRTAPVAVQGGHSFQMLAAGANHTCGVTTTGAAYCWGYNGFGQLGDGTTQDRSTPTLVAGGHTFKSLHLGWEHTCGVTTTGQAYCWGRNANSELGDGTATDRHSPTPVLGGHTFLTLATGLAYTCGINTSGAAYCWGVNWAGHLGGGTPTAPRNTPGPVAGGLTFQAITAGQNHACGISTAGEGWCWGFNERGMVGDGSTTSRYSPVRVSGGLVLQAISANISNHTCAVTTTGTTHCWGLSSHGGTGDGQPGFVMAPQAVSGGSGYSAVDAGELHTCGTNTSGAAFCWGFNIDGRVGDGTTLDRFVPTAVAGGRTFQTISAGFGGNTCALSSGAAYCWGVGSVGDGTTSTRLTPTAVSGGHTFQAISAGWNSSCAITVTGVGYCWGQNNFGQLGDNSTTTGTVPVPVANGLTFKAITAGGFFTCGLTTAGAAYCWGLNNEGQLGDGTTTNRQAPVPVLGGLTFESITAGHVHACGITTTGSAYCWGAPHNGRLGDGTFTPRLTPTAVVGGLTFKAIAAGGAHTCAISTSNAAFCWGVNFHGSLGDGTTTDRSSPVAVVGGLSMRSITVGGVNGASCGVTTADVAYCWGYRDAGILGDGLTVMRKTPVQVVGL